MCIKKQRKMLAATMLVVLVGIFAAVSTGRAESPAGLASNSYQTSPVTYGSQEKVVFYFQGGWVEPGFINSEKSVYKAQSSVSLLQNMHYGSNWYFFENGTFIFKPAGIGTIVRDDLFPVRGTYQVTDKGIKFSGTRRISNSTFNVSFVIDGIIGKKSDGTVWAYIGEETRSSTAAVVNNMKFGNSIYKYMEFRLPMN